MSDFQDSAIDDEVNQWNAAAHDENFAWINRSKVTKKPTHTSFYVITFYLIERVIQQFPDAILIGLSALFPNWKFQQEFQPMALFPRNLNTI